MNDEWQEIGTKEAILSLFGPVTATGADLFSVDAREVGGSFDGMVSMGGERVRVPQRRTGRGVTYQRATRPHGKQQMATRMPTTPSLC